VYIADGTHVGPKSVTVQKSNHQCCSAGYADWIGSAGTLLLSDLIFERSQTRALNGLGRAPMAPL
jgi:hypothetical protein